MTDVTHQEYNTLSWRATLARDVYERVIRTVESLEVDNLGSDLAYLLGAILMDTRCEWPVDRPLSIVLREHTNGDHAVWKYIEIETD